MASLIGVEGIGEVYAEKLAQAGIGTTAALLEEGAKRSGRKAIAAKTGISETLVLRWVNQVDLQRVKGIGGQYSDLLEAAGVDSVSELAKRSSEALHAQLAESNAQKKLVRQLPTQVQVKSWIESAAQLPRVVEH